MEKLAQFKADKVIMLFKSAIHPVQVRLLSTLQQIQEETMQHQIRINIIFNVNYMYIYKYIGL